MRAVVVTLDDKVVGIGGVARDYECGNFFSEHKKELEPHLGSITVWRSVKRAMEFVKEYRGPVVALSKHPEGSVNLHRLGFEHLHGEFWVWHN